ncbi:hypothetical protein C7M84_006722, partial [Penaeus vannamei]
MRSARYPCELSDYEMLLIRQAGWSSGPTTTPRTRLPSSGGSFSFFRWVLFLLQVVSVLQVGFLFLLQVGFPLSFLVVGGSLLLQGFFLLQVGSLLLQAGSSAFFSGGFSSFFRWVLFLLQMGLRSSGGFSSFFRWVSVLQVGLRLQVVLFLLQVGSLLFQWVLFLLQVVSLPSSGGFFLLQVGSLPLLQVGSLSIHVGSSPFFQWVLFGFLLVCGSPCSFFEVGSLPSSGGFSSFFRWVLFLLGRPGFLSLSSRWVRSPSFRWVLFASFKVGSLPSSGGFSSFFRWVLFCFRWWVLGRRLLDYLPEHACRLKFSDLISFSSKSTPEIRIIEQFRSIPSNVTARKLVRKYLEFSWSLPYYGSAFFHGQIEQPTRGVSSWLPRPDLPVLVTINGTGVSVIDPKKSTVLLSLRYDELSWDYARPSNERNLHCLPCLFLQFAVVENGIVLRRLFPIAEFLRSMVQVLWLGF